MLDIEPIKKRLAAATERHAGESHWDRPEFRPSDQGGEPWGSFCPDRRDDYELLDHSYDDVVALVAEVELMRGAMSTDPPPRAQSVEHIIADLRWRGWAVAVHNDYRKDGAAYTFWLFTRGGGPLMQAIKGEGRSDRAALMQCRDAAEDLGEA